MENTTAFMDSVSTTLMPATPSSTPVSKFRSFDVNYLQQQIGFYLGLALYAVYIYLIATKTTKPMQPYRKVLAFHCLLDLLFVIQNLILHGEYPCLTTDKGYKCFVFVTAMFVYPPRFFVWLSEAWNASVVSWNVPGIALIFLYRYFLICRNYQFSIPLFSFCAFLSFVFPVTIYALVQGYRVWPKPEEEDLVKNFLSSEWLYEGRPPTFIVYPDNMRLIDRTAFIIPSYFAYLVIFYTTYKVNETLNSFKNTTVAVKRMQREMTIVLWIQAILPFISHIIPFTSVIVRNLIGLDASFLYYFTKASIWAPAINAALSIFIITPYRDFIKRSFLFWYKKPIEPQSISDTRGSSLSPVIGVDNRVANAP